MLKEWSTRERKLIVSIVILSVLLLSMIFSTWMKKDEAPQPGEFSRQIQGNLEEEQKEEPERMALPIQQEEDFNRDQENSIIGRIMVDIKGAVHHPFVYVMSEEDRVIDVIDKAGGLLAEASTKQINLAQKVFDGMVIYIPTEEEMRENLKEYPFAPILDIPSLEGQVNSSSSGKININTASAVELETLPGIGPSKAQAIISYREENGAFTVPEDIMKVSGIGTKTFANLKDEIDVR